MGSTKETSHLDRVVEALTIVAPLCIASRYEDGFKHCVEASVSGAAALRKRNIDARPVPCSLVAFTEDGGGLTIGLSPQQLYERLLLGDDPPQVTFERWRDEVARQVPDAEVQFHEVIEARAAGVLVRIDLTLGQLRQTGAPHASSIPLTLVLRGKEWPAIEAPPWTFSYSASAHAGATLSQHNSNVKKYSNAAFVADLNDLIELALRHDLDRERVYSEVARQQPDSFAECMARIQNLSRPLVGTLAV